MAVKKRNSQGRDPRTREAKTARDRDPRTREQRRAVPTAGEVFATQHVETRHVEKNGTRCFKSGSQRQLGQQVCPGWVECDHQHRPEDENETDQSKIETVCFG